MEIQHFFDPSTWTLSYLCYDSSARVGVVIDGVANYDPRQISVFYESADEILRFVDAQGLKIPFVIDTHVHADHITAMPYLCQKLGAQSVIDENVSEVQSTFAPIFNLGKDFPCDGRQFDILVGDGQKLDTGAFVIEALHSPGHTPASSVFRVEDALFVGDVIFQPDSGTARCDFPGGSAAELYDSIQRIYDLPPETRIFTAHDYQPGGRKLAFESTVREQRRSNKHLHDGVSKEDFVALRQRLEAGKELPRLLFPSLQINIRAGHLPEAEDNGRAYLKLPIDLF